MQTITKTWKTYCQTAVDYPPEIVRQMKKAGYRVRQGKEKAGNDAR